MGRTPLSMVLLARRLRRAGHPVHLFGYSVTFEAFEAIVDRLVRQVERTLRKKAGDGDEVPYAIVGHSLGGVITRAAWPRLPQGLGRVVMLATPNKSPVLARRVAELPLLRPLFETLTGDAGRRLTEEDFFRQLPIPEVPTLVIAGSGGPRIARLPFEEAHDGIVAVEETQLEGAEHHTTEAIHTFLMNRPDVVERILESLGSRSSSSDLSSPDPSDQDRPAMPLDAEGVERDSDR